MPKPSIDFTNKDFESIKQALVNYAKLYFPDTYKNFNEASFGAMVFDNLSHIGDILSFHIDYHGNESFIDSAIQIDNIEKLAKQLGYKNTGNGASQGSISIFIKIPANNFSEPDRNYLPILKKDSQFLSKNGSSFLLTEDIDFNSDLTEFIVVEINSNGVPISYAAKQVGNVISGEKFVQTQQIGYYDGFLKIKIQNPNFIETLLVEDSNGNEYFNIDYLSQNIIYKPTLNTDPDSNKFVRNIMQRFFVTRKFVIEKIGDFYYLVFGKGSIDRIKDPNEILLKYYGRNYSYDNFFDPGKILETDKFGIGPIDTTLTINYRANSNSNINVGIGGITNVINPVFEFPTSAISQNVIDSIQSSIEVTNEEIITGFVDDTTIDEIKQRSKDSYASQGRAVTQSDYISLVYGMDGRYGSIKRANIVKDKKSIRNNLNLFVLSEMIENENPILTETNDIIKKNLKEWLESRRLVSDTIDILDAKIINLKISFVVHGASNKDKNDIQSECMNALINKFSSKLEIGQPFDISSIYKTLNLLPSVVDTKNVIIEALNGSDYNYNNFDINKYLSADETFIECPDDVCFEIKYPNKDIKATILKFN